MVKFLVLSALLAVVTVATAATIPTEAIVDGAARQAAVMARRRMPPLTHEEIHDEFGQFALRYVTAEGTVVTQRGRLVLAPDGQSHVMVQEGEVTYIGDDGQTYTTKYNAGLDGTHVEGTHLPVPVEPLEPLPAQL